MAADGDFSFPDSFLHPAKCLVVLTGLDTRNNAVHMAIWDLFTSGGRGDRKPILYRHVTADHLYPREAMSPEVEDSAFVPASPNGILKSDWICKHSYELPSVAVFFYELDWSDPQWKEKVTECASKVRVIRSSLDSHATELCVALIQSKKPLPTGQDPVISEQANEVCQACEISPPCLFVMPYIDRPEGFVNRLEVSFYELALHYYTNRVRKIRVTKDLTSRPQILLSIRRQFKLAYFTEMRQEHKEALKHYSSCYKYLLDSMWSSEDRIMEFKMVAGLLNYKICYLMFEYEDPRHALGQFQHHLEIFRTQKGPDSLLFQHMEWMTNQFVAFGDLFAEAVRKQLRPTHTVHPGIYYYEAIQFLLERRKLQQKICKESYEKLQKPLPLIPGVEFVGQRPWRVGLNDSQPSESELREPTIALLQAKEFTVNFSYQVCVLLNKALDHFNQLHHHRTTNMINNLNVLLGEEYLLSKEYDKSLAFLERVVSVYRKHGWWLVLNHLLEMMLKCSFVLGHVQTYVSIILELTSRFLPLGEDKKKRYHNNLNLILKGHPPQHDVEAETEPIQDMWYGNLSALEEQEEPLVLLMSSLAGCVECKTVFSSTSYYGDSIVKLYLHLRSSAPFFITLNHVQVLLDNQIYHQWCTTNSQVLLEPGGVVTLEYTFPVLSDTLQVSSVKALMGPFKLVWKDGISFSQIPIPRDWNWNRIINRTSANVRQRQAHSLLILEEAPPILLGEYYPVRVRVKNEEIKAMRSIQICAIFILDDSKTKGKDEGSVPLIQLYSSLLSPLSSSSLSSSSSSSVSSSASESLYSVQMSCDQLDPQNEFAQTFYVKSSSIGTQKINITLSYSVDCTVRDDWDLVTCVCQKEELLCLETVSPLRVSHRILNMKFQPVDVVFYDEPFLLQSSILSLSPWQLSLSNTRHHFDSSVSVSDQSLAPSQDIILSQQDIATELQCITVNSRSPNPTNIKLTLGTYHYNWKRQKKEEEGEGEGERRPDVIKKVSLPQVNVKYLPYTVTADLPSCGSLHKLMPVTFKINNKTILVNEYEAHLSLTSDFNCSGNKLSRFRVLPHSSHHLKFNLVPRTSGYVTFPRLEVTCISQPKLDEQVLQGAAAGLPSSVYVMPLNTDVISSPQSSMTSSLTAASVIASV